MCSVGISPKEIRLHYKIINNQENLLTNIALSLNKTEKI